MQFVQHLPDYQNPLRRPRSFHRWLMGQRRRPDPIGDLARDAALDPKWPCRSRTLQGFQHHLEHMGACDGAELALEDAWSEWEAGRITTASMANGSMPAGETEIP
jgi:hypothetical protein